MLESVSLHKLFEMFAAKDAIYIILMKPFYLEMFRQICIEPISIQKGIR